MVSAPRIHEVDNDNAGEPEERSGADDRDRDEDGRARQARPRDALGRPLPYGAQGVEPVSEEPLPPDETLAFARRLVDEGRPFAAHEVFEVRWKTGPGEERELWQGLAQLCVGLTHALRGNHVGAVRLVERAAGRLERYDETDAPTYGLRLPEVIACARTRLAEQLG
jgi:hypothetical protein